LYGTKPSTPVPHDPLMPRSGRGSTTGRSGSAGLHPVLLRTRGFRGGRPAIKIDGPSPTSRSISRAPRSSVPIRPSCPADPQTVSRSRAECWVDEVLQDFPSADRPLMSGTGPRRGDDRREIGVRCQARRLGQRPSSYCTRSNRSEIRNANHPQSGRYATTSRPDRAGRDSGALRRTPRTSDVTSCAPCSPPGPTGLPEGAPAGESCDAAGPGVRTLPPASCRPRFSGRRTILSASRLA